MKFFEIDGVKLPEYLRKGNAMQYILPFAQRYCVGKGLDIGSKNTPLPGATAIDNRYGGNYDAFTLPAGPWDFIFSSHCLEHLEDTQEALNYWSSLLKPGGCMFLYLPHGDNPDWHPKNNKQHLHVLDAERIRWEMLNAGLKDIITTGRDLLWSFTVVGFKS